MRPVDFSERRCRAPARALRTAPHGKRNRPAGRRPLPRREMEAAKTTSRNAAAGSGRSIADKLSQIPPRRRESGLRVKVRQPAPCLRHTRWIASARFSHLSPEVIVMKARRGLSPFRLGALVVTSILMSYEAGGGHELPHRQQSHERHVQRWPGAGRRELRGCL